MHGAHQIFDQRDTGQDIDMLVTRQNINELATALTKFGYDVTIHAPDYQYLYGAQPHVHCRHHRLDIMFDLHTSLFYLSVGCDRTYVNVDEKVLQSMFDDKVKVDEPWLYEPSVESYVTHLCCRVIFDKRSCDDKYRNWIQEGYEKCDKNKLRELFKHIFHSVTDSLLECIAENQTKQLYKNYITSSQY